MTKSIEQLSLEWMIAEEEAFNLNSLSLKVIAGEKFNLFIAKVQEEALKYHIPCNFENLCGDNEYRKNIINKIYEQYEIEEENKAEQEKREGEIDRAEFYHGEDR